VNVELIRQHELPPSNIARELVGADHGGLGLCTAGRRALPELDLYFLTCRGSGVGFIQESEMVSELHRQIADALAAGADLRAIEETIVDRAPLDEENRAALWLYAEALRERVPVTADEGPRRIPG
jgi:hypothetical protein